MKVKTKIYLALLLGFLLSVMYSCNKNELKKDDSVPAKPYVPKLFRITVKSDSTKIQPWQSLPLTATGYDSLGHGFAVPKFIWSSSDSICVSVSQDGLITGNLLDSAKISAAADGVTGSMDMLIDIKNSFLVSKNILLDSLGSFAETSVAVNPKNPLNIAASANWANFSSFNGGRTWKRIDNGNSGLAQADPNVCFLLDGTLLRQGLSLDYPRGIVVQRSNDGGLTLPVSQLYNAYKPAVDMGNADQGIEY